MADMTAQDMSDYVLTHLNVKAAGQAANPEDAALAMTAINAAHSQLRGLGLAPFELTAIPEWAQVPFRNYIAADLGPSFGFGNSLKIDQKFAERELQRQCIIHKPSIRTKAQYF
jgi:hypothetical protein